MNRVWVIYFIDALEGPTGWTLAPYVTSEFSLHGLTAITSVVAQLVAGLFRLPLAKVRLDLFPAHHFSADTLR